jgi:hypothetical protein
MVDMGIALCYLEHQFSPHPSDNGALFQPFSDLYRWGDFIEVGINCMQAVIVFDNNDIFEHGGRFGKDDFAVKNRFNFGIGGCRTKRYRVIKDFNPVNRIGVRAEAFGYNISIQRRNAPFTGISGNIRGTVIGDCLFNRFRNRF